MRFFTRRHILGAILVAVLATLAWVAFRPQPVPVDLAMVTRGTLEVTVEAEGVTQIRQIYQVSAPLTGYAARSPVDVGDPVVAGETVVAAIAPAAPAFLDARARQEAEAAVTVGEAALSAADARVDQSASDLEYAQAQYKRSEALAGRGVIPQSSLDDAALRLHVAETALAAAKSEREMARATLTRAKAALIDPTFGDAGASDEACCIRIRAPADGRILSIVNRSARLVQAGEPLLDIGKPDELEVEVELLSSDAVRVSPGAAAHVERWGGPALSALLRRVDPSAFTKVSALGIEEQRVRAYLDFDGPVEDRAALGDNFRIYVRIVAWRGDDVLMVPVSALFRDGGDWAVFRLAGDRAELARVEIGHRNARDGEVLAGLSEGDRVVTFPGDRVQAGTLVVERMTDSAGN
ncbi:MAG: HlyD family efflux transporter periplasmic adaptor subunit [Rhodobacteraceae bacterium]|nr:HlyD family efflux transporter periplasmic adaptor subunit [Paracoccaceae bacterium]